LIGSAQSRKKEGLLQHGSLPLIGDLARICDALVYENEAARTEASKRLLARAATVESALGRALSWEMAAQAFIHAFEAQLGLSRSPHQVLTKRAGLSLKRGELSESESKRTDELVKEKYAHAAWTERV